MLSIFPGAALSLFSIDEGSREHEPRTSISKPPKLHGRDGATTDGRRLDDASLLFLDARVKTGMRTIETGAGVSTIAFALNGLSTRVSSGTVKSHAEFVSTAHLPAFH